MKSAAPQPEPIDQSFQQQLSKMLNPKAAQEPRGPKRLDVEQLRHRQSFKGFRMISYAIAGFFAANAYGLLWQIPGFWIVGWLVLLVLLCFSAPMLLTAYLNIQKGDRWYDGFDPDKLVICGIVAAIALTGIALQLYRTGALS